MTSLNTLKRRVCPAASFFDRQNQDSSPQEVDPFCMASTAEDISLEYLTEDWFMLRLELRIRCPENESTTFAIRRRILPGKRTVLCEVSNKKALLIAEKWMVSVERQISMGDESTCRKNGSLQNRRPGHVSCGQCSLSFCDNGSHVYCTGS